MQAPVFDTKIVLLINDEGAAYGPCDASNEGEIDSEVDAAPAAPESAARGVDDEDNEDAEEGEGNENECWDGADGALGGE
ncbi:hypothetical protein GMDG_00658 [Pseudogymnoascus destructans 20631-21]|uniref:Uncharacterized protein n=1 Tax=Pseudogymnoascus destructans (strain ATCC MYA-4855 / 20631-21) TaxID=658429 RepID=L8GBQ5_PSED2|nr:hypothetical protein GMDG_00658 [Pseudogymnoascus destructans 20631-21]